MQEVWKPIKGYENKYEVSNRGRIRRAIVTSSGFTEYKDLATRSVRGYLNVILSKNGEQKGFYVHRLVALAFIDNPYGYAVVNHKDYDKLNNDVTNLEWCSQKYNVNYSAPNMRKPKRTLNQDKYIRERKNGRFELAIRLFDFTFYKTYDTYQEAVSARNKVLGECGYGI